MAGLPKIAASVTLYHPDMRTVANIRSYIEAVDHLYIVDNGGGVEVVAAFATEVAAGSVSVLRYLDNAGIARPLNDVLEMCQGSYEFLLTMDQDSSFAPGSMAAFIRAVSAFDWTHTLGLGALTIGYDDPVSRSSAVTWEMAYRLITSGNIISVANALAIGGFSEALFIDEVDHEFCFRGRARGYLSYQCTAGVYLRHQIGAPVECKCIFKRGKRRWLTIHNHTRLYYIFRNGLYVFAHYWRIAPASYMLTSCVLYLLRTAKNVVVWEPDKWRKLRYICYGVMDFLRIRMGKYQH